MLFSNVVTTIAAAAAIILPTIPGCGTISSMFLKIGLVMTASNAATVVEKAVAGESIKTPLFTVAFNTVVLGGAIYLVVASVLPATVGVLVAMLLTMSMTAATTVNVDAITQDLSFNVVGVKDVN